MNVWRQGGDAISVAATTEANEILPTMDGGESPAFVAVAHTSTAGCWVRFGGSAVTADGTGFLVPGGFGTSPQRFAVGGHTHIATKVVSGTATVGVTPLAESRQ